MFKFEIYNRNKYDGITSRFYHVQELCDGNHYEQNKMYYELSNGYSSGWSFVEVKWITHV